MSKILNHIICTKSILHKTTNFSVRQQTYATRKRFYKNTGIIQNDKKWEVTLDHRRLKTPNGKNLLLDSEALARAIAVEWDSQTDVISQATMHLTALCNTALDNPGNLTVHDITSYLLEYTSTDTLLFHNEDQEGLKLLQEKRWVPILEWFEKRFDVKLEVSHELQVGQMTTETRAALARHLLSYDFPSLNALCFGVEALKSTILMLACVEKRILPREAVMLSRLEEEFQVLHWGRVPWAHELSQAELTARVSAALLTIHSRQETHNFTTKSSPHETNIQ